MPPFCRVIIRLSAFFYLSAMLSFGAFAGVYSEISNQHKKLKDITDRGRLIASRINSYGWAPFLFHKFDELQTEHFLEDFYRLYANCRFMREQDSALQCQWRIPGRPDDYVRQLLSQADSELSALEDTIMQRCPSYCGTSVEQCFKCEEASVVERFLQPSTTMVASRLVTAVTTLLTGSLGLYLHFNQHELHEQAAEYCTGFAASMALVIASTFFAQDELQQELEVPLKMIFTRLGWIASERRQLFSTVLKTRFTADSLDINSREVTYQPLLSDKKSIVIDLDEEQSNSKNHFSISTEHGWHNQQVTVECGEVDGHVQEACRVDFHNFRFSVLFWGKDRFKLSMELLETFSSI